MGMSTLVTILDQIHVLEHVCTQAPAHAKLRKESSASREAGAAEAAET